MSDKLARAQHTRVADSSAKHAAHTASDAVVAIERTASDVAERVPAHAPENAQKRVREAAPTPQPTEDFLPEPAVDPGSTSRIPVTGRHVGTDRTKLGKHGGTDRTVADRAPETTSNSPASCEFAAPEADGEAANTAESVGSSAALISACVMISRVLGFVRTWVMAFALGSTLLASSYQVANNLPAQLYELVIGGMIVTAFLPVYLSVKKKLGHEASNEYASNLLTIVVILLGAVSAFCIAFPSLLIYTQSFYSDQAEMAQSVFFFQFFAIQIVFSGATAIISGLLNANRDYLWSSIAPAANNVVVIATFLLYAAIAPQNPDMALYIIAIGNPLGVFIALAMQLPALKRNGIRLRPRINFRDPALRETLGIGIPAVFVMVCSFIVVSVQNAAAYSFADNGPSILLYARQWFTLPYAFLAVPITTAMFTELSDMQAEGDIDGVKRGIVGGTNQILFFMIPFALYLMVFSLPLVSLFHAGAFTMDSIFPIASYMSVLALALPVYGINTYLQKIFSSLRRMGVFAAFNFVAGAAQIALTMFGAAHADQMPIEIIAVAEVLFYVIADICLFVYLRIHLGAFGLGSIIKACVRGILFGGCGAAVGAGALLGLETFIAPLAGSIGQAVVYILVGGSLSLVATFGLALKLNVPEAAFLRSLTAKVARKLKRA